MGPNEISVRKKTYSNEFANFLIRKDFSKFAITTGIIFCIF
jgi:hypothetical protein